MAHWKTYNSLLQEFKFFCWCPCSLFEFFRKFHIDNFFLFYLSLTKFILPNIQTSLLFYFADVFCCLYIYFFLRYKFVFLSTRLQLFTSQYLYVSGFVIFIFRLVIFFIVFTSLLVITHLFMSVWVYFPFVPTSPRAGISGIVIF